MGAWKMALGNGCGNCVCFHSEFAPLPEVMEETVMESELAAFDEAWFNIQQVLTEEEAWLRQQASLTRVDVSRALLKAKYTLWLQFWTPRLKKSCKNKRGQELERCRKAEAEAEAAVGSIPSPGPKPLKRLFKTEAAPTAASGHVRPSASDRQRELDGVQGRSMVRWSDKATCSRSMNHLTAADGTAAAESGSEGKMVWKALFPDEAETSRRREQRRWELIHQHENPRKPTPLMDLNVEVCLDLNVKVCSEKRSKSMNCLTGCSEKEECTRTVCFIPAGSESTHHQQQGAKPKRQTASIFLHRHQADAVTNDAINAVGASHAVGTANAATFLTGIGRGLGNRFLLPPGYETMEREEKKIWDKRVRTLKQKVLPLMAPTFHPKLKAWKKAPENWPRPGQTDVDTLTDWLKFEKQVRGDERFADAEPPTRKPTPVQHYTKTLEERFRTCRWRIFLPDGFYGHAEEDIPPWMQRWCQHLLETT